MLWEAMYVQDGPVVIPNTQPREAIIMPQDQAKYLSRAMVGKFTSQEVAKVFHTRITFSSRSIHTIIF